MQTRAPRLYTAVVLALLIAGALCPATTRADDDPIVGTWQTKQFFNGNYWMTYRPDGSVTYEVNPKNVPKTAPQTAAQNAHKKGEAGPRYLQAIKETGGTWVKGGDVYKEHKLRQGKPFGAPAYYKLVDGQLAECDATGNLKANGLRWSRKQK